MRRVLILCLFLLLLALGTFCTQPMYAQEAPGEASWGLFDNAQRKLIQSAAKDVEANGWRKTGHGHYFSIVKIGAYMILFWLWVMTSTWANCDAERLGDSDRQTWNTYLYAIFPSVFFPAFFIPIFWIGFPAAFLGFLFPIMRYVVHRNSGRLEAEKVMTREHIVFVIRGLFGGKNKKKKAVYETGSPIQLFAGGKDVDEQTRNGRTILARNMPGFNFFREILYYSIRRNAMAVGVEFTPNQVKYQFEIDGIWHPIEGIFKKPLTMENAQDLAAAAKTLVGLNIKDRRTRQTGAFYLEYDKKKKAEAEFTSQGSKTGELFIIRYTMKKINFSSLDEIGMVAERQQHFRSLLNAEHGLFVLSAQSGQGLRTLTDVAFNIADRYTRDFVTIEDIQNPYLNIENVTLNTYDSSKGQKPNDVLPDIFFKDPKVLLIRDLVNMETLSLCCEEVKNDRLVISTFRGKDSAETLMRLLSTGVDPQLLADTLIGIVTQKLVRRLCPVCREEIPPNPHLLLRFGIPVGSIKTIYRKRVRPQLGPGEKSTYKPCKDCNELGYIGRVGIFDFLEVNDEIRKVIVSHPTVEAIRKAATDSGQLGFLVDGGPLVADGTTSFEELSRVLK